jgi:copper ion binding protein
MKMKLALASSMLAGALAFATALPALACPGEDSEKSAKNEAKPAAPVPATATTAAFRVTGMHCAGCEDHVREALNKVDGVYKVDVKMADKRVIVSFDKAKVTAETIAKTISDAGYKAAAEV